MTTTDEQQEINRRKANIEAELTAEIADAQRRVARQNIWLTGSMVLMVGSGILSGAINLFTNAPGIIPGLIAFIPAAILSADAAFKFQERYNWHRNREIELRTLLSRLRDQLPATPSADNVAAVARDKMSAELAAEKDWQDKFSFNFLSFGGAPHRPPPDSGSSHSV